MIMFVRPYQALSVAATAQEKLDHPIEFCGNLGPKSLFPEVANRSPQKNVIIEYL